MRTRREFFGVLLAAPIAAVVALQPKRETDSEFRAWVRAFHDDLVRRGWKATSDHGQVFTTIIMRNGSTLEFYNGQ